MAQLGKCPICSETIDLQAQWDIHHKVWKVNGGSDDDANLTLVHMNCHKQIHARGCTQWPPAWLKTQA